VLERENKIWICF